MREALWGSAPRPAENLFAKRKTTEETFCGQKGFPRTPFQKTLEKF